MCQELELSDNWNILYPRNLVRFGCVSVNILQKGDNE
jgi:hypothetical protein